MGPAHGQAGVDLQVERRQEALVDGQRGQRGGEAVVAVGPGVQRAAAQRRAAEAARPVAADPPLSRGAAAHRAGGADPLGPAQTHGGWRRREMRRQRGEVR